MLLTRNQQGVQPQNCSPWANSPSRPGGPTPRTTTGAADSKHHAAVPPSPATLKWMEKTSGFSKLSVGCSATAGTVTNIAYPYI